MAGTNGYFSFSKRERTGVFVLIVLIAVVFLLPEFIPVPRTSMDADAVSDFKKQIAALEKIDSVSAARASGIHDREDGTVYDERSVGTEQAAPFYFDPNTITGQGWKKLGISDRTIQTIQKYKSRGGSFRKAEDIGRIYGLKKGQYERLLPFVRIEQRDQEMYKKSDDAYKPELKKFKPAPTIIDINAADTTALIALPGIGSKLANRIILFREKLGGFYSVDQFAEVYGLLDSTLQKIKPFLKCTGSAIQQININTADATVLKNHPYIKWNIANAIVNYRLQHGEYKSVEELLKIEIIVYETLQKLTPYLRVD